MDVSDVYFTIGDFIEREGEEREREEREEREREEKERKGKRRQTLIVRKNDVRRRMFQLTSMKRQLSFQDEQT